MTSVLRKLFGHHRKKATKKDSITGRNNSFPVPYLSKLEGNQLQPGQSLVVRGVIVAKCDFVINLTKGPRVELDDSTDTLDDRLLCMRVEMEPTKNVVHLNACINGEWGREGIVKHKWNCGDEFDIRIRCHDDEFEVFIEHRLVAHFTHYVSLSNITHIYINGGIELYSVSWEGRNYTVPYAADIPGNFYPGRKLYVSGLIKKNAKQFFIEMYSGPNVAFRLRAIFRFSSKKLSGNTRLDQEWSLEERFLIEDFPFRKKKTFDLLIYCEETKYLVYVDDCLIGKYEHRISPRTVDRMMIDGHLVLHGVHLK